MNLVLFEFYDTAICICLFCEDRNVDSTGGLIVVYPAVNGLFSGLRMTDMMSVTTR